MRVSSKAAGAISATLAIAGTLSAWFLENGPEKIMHAYSNEYSPPGEVKSAWISGYISTPLMLSIAAGAAGYFVGKGVHQGVTYLSSRLSTPRIAAHTLSGRHGIFSQPVDSESQNLLSESKVADQVTVPVTPRFVS